MQVFLSHRSSDDTEVEYIKSYLERCFIKVWLDKNELKGGDALSGKFLRGIKGNTTIAFISEKYAESPWCKEEFTRAYNENIRGTGTIIPVMFGDDEDIKRSVRLANFDELDTFLADNNYIKYDASDREKSCDKIADAIQKNNYIRFRPLKEVEIYGKVMQFIDFTVEPNTPLEVFQTWDCNFENFIDHNNDGAKPIKKEIPIAIFGKGPCWLYAHLAIPFYNKYEVYIFNEPTGKFLCVYARQTNKHVLGEVLNTR